MHHPSSLRSVSRLAAGALLGLLAASAVQAQGTFTLSSPDLRSGSFDNKFVLNGFGCKGSIVILKNLIPFEGIADSFIFLNLPD